MDNGRNNIIVGIDPGTTMGYSILDLEGNIIELSSTRLLNISRLITHLTHVGQVLVVAADKNPVPGFVKQLATKLGARLIYPKQNLKVDEKKQLADFNDRSLLE